MSDETRHNWNREILERDYEIQKLRAENTDLRDSVRRMQERGAEKTNRVLDLEDRLVIYEELALAAARYYKAQSARYRRELGDAIDAIERLPR